MGTLIGIHLFFHNYLISQLWGSKMMRKKHTAAGEELQLMEESFIMGNECWNWKQQPNRYTPIQCSFRSSTFQIHRRALPRQHHHTPPVYCLVFFFHLFCDWLEYADYWLAWIVLSPAARHFRTCALYKQQFFFFPHAHTQKGHLADHEQVFTKSEIIYIGLASMAAPLM